MDGAEMMARRKRLGVLRKDLADLATVRTDTYTKWEKNKKTPGDAVDIRVRLERLEDMSEMIAKAVYDQVCNEVDAYPEVYVPINDQQLWDNWGVWAARGATVDLVQAATAQAVIEIRWDTGQIVPILPLPEEKEKDAQ